MNPLQLLVYIWMYFQQLRIEDPKYASDIFINVNNIPGINKSTLLGTLEMKNIELRGFSTLPPTSPSNTDITVTEDSDGNNNICVKNVFFDYVHLNGEYSADIGILDKIPIYGNGIFTFGIRDVKLELCTFLNLQLGRVEDFNIDLSYRHQPITISGFWKNEDFSVFLSDILTLGHKLFAMFNLYDPKCAACILNPILEYMLNAFAMGYPDSTLNFGGCACTEEILSSIRNFESLEEGEKELFEIFLKSAAAYWQNDTFGLKLIEELLDAYNKFS